MINYNIKIIVFKHNFNLFACLINFIVIELNTKRCLCMKERNIISIDLKSFFASCECVDRKLDPFKVPLVVADTSRGKGATCLAVSPYLRNMGVDSRSKVFELPKNVKIIYAKPRMKLYETYSQKVIDIYKEFFRDEDIHIYSIDEVFIHAHDYL